jgi:hypothetical protein
MGKGGCGVASSPPGRVQPENEGVFFLGIVTSFFKTLREFCEAFGIGKAKLGCYVGAWHVWFVYIPESCESSRLRLNSDWGHNALDDMCNGGCDYASPCEHS